LGVINVPDELNSVINTERLRDLSTEMGFDLLSLEYNLGDGEEADPAQIPALMQALKDQGADAVYVGSSSFNLQHRDAFTRAAVDVGLPVFAAYEQMVRQSDGLMAVASSYVNVGKLAGRQAFRLLFEGQVPDSLGVTQLDRYSIFINMRVARELDVYPPIQLLRIAEIVQ
jgi:putative ABC transport system substrate-binding protein